MAVTRDDIARSVGSAFIGGGAARFDLVCLARANQAPAEILTVLVALPARRFTCLHDLWDCLSRAEDGAVLAA